jgi:molybdopterin molybdotransferase
LPGNPVSVLATAHLFLFPVIRRMLGLGPSWWRPIALAEAIQPNDRRELFRAAALTQEAAARVLPWHGSGDLAHTALAAGWVRLPMQEPSLQPGQIVPYLPMLT